MIRVRAAALSAGLVLTTSLMSSPGMAQDRPARDQTVERTARGAAGSDIRVGLYVNVQPDCSSGTLPTIRLVSKPGNGRVTVKSAKVKARNYKNCLAVETPGYVAFYRAHAGFSGTDTFLIEVRYPGGRTETQRIRVTVTSPGQKI